MPGMVKIATIPFDFWVSEDGSMGNDRIILYNWPQGGMEHEESVEVDRILEYERFSDLVKWAQERGIPYALSEFNQETKIWELNVYAPSNT